MLLMLLDHVRETFFLHMQVPDPMIAGETLADRFLVDLLLIFVRRFLFF
ncbi:hypothetical protein ARAF_2071 [Arsenophonus endosymbiont of Aleurodicus floccissimus]|nr:hypothetical protein [Arsenophonus endosymbiont of Aleurodicus floccissimus]SPP32177.1 hypothetical protein ARAF_2071 [Arsenophonus endosymbiont of Aleurodicus floccissimus]